MISFIVPAHNEQAVLGRTLQAIHESALAIAQPYEIIVADDASTDATAEIAARNNASVVSVNNRQIAATRNAGGRAANGERLFFIDADTLANPKAVAAALRAMDSGAVGGGAPALIEKNEIVPLYVYLLAPIVFTMPKLVGFSGGAFMFCTREAFQATGGFNERLFWAEEGLFALALKREGRFVGLWESVVTSGRRFRKVSGLQLLAGGARTIFSPKKGFTQRSAVEKVWYDSNRSDDDIMPTSAAVRISNGITLFVLLVVLTNPIWSRVPKSMTPWSSPLGKARFVAGFFICHLGLVLWPVAILLFTNLLRQKHWAGVLQSLATIACCVCIAWGATQGVIFLWTKLGLWILHFYSG